MQDEFMIKEVKTEEYKKVSQYIRNIYFLPKKTWGIPLYEMALEGLDSGKWKAIGMYNENDELVSYLDYKMTKVGNVEIGICFTLEEYRGKHFMGALIEYLKGKFPDKAIEVGTYENNIAMRKCFERLGFQEVNEKQDRIDGTKSIYYCLGC